MVRSSLRIVSYNVNGIRAAIKWLIIFSRSSGIMTSRIMSSVKVINIGGWMNFLSILKS